MVSPPVQNLHPTPQTAPRPLAPCPASCPESAAACQGLCAVLILHSHPLSHLPQTQTPTPHVHCHNRQSNSKLILHYNSRETPLSLKFPLNAVLCSLRALIVALNDEVAQVRATAIASIGRVSARNPAYAMPALRRHLMQLLADMNQAPESRQREGALGLGIGAQG